jgi:hypothetical protein
MLGFEQRLELGRSEWRPLGWSSWFLGLIAMVALSCLVGCGEPEPQRFAISGTITLDDKPIGPALMTLVPTSAGQVGCTCEVTNGRFDSSPGAGATAGPFHAVLSPLEPDLEEYEARRAAGEKKLFGSVVIPAKYQKPGSLTVEVAAERDNHLTIELHSR